MSVNEGEQREFDLLVVGGGATGAGVAVDAASRGLKVALVEMDDFGSGARYRSLFQMSGQIYLHFYFIRCHRDVFEVD